ncbi:MAG: hypothetical protein HQL54_13210 [Magnetococcales bacterium]|nr:hypothetical protein [Magnetococcales bacterium]
MLNATQMELLHQYASKGRERDGITVHSDSNAMSQAARVAILTEQNSNSPENDFQAVLDKALKQGDGD